MKCVILVDVDVSTKTERERERERADLIQEKQKMYYKGNQN